MEGWSQRHPAAFSLDVRLLSVLGHSWMRRRQGWCHCAQGFVYGSIEQARQLKELWSNTKLPFQLSGGFRHPSWCVSKRKCRYIRTYHVACRWSMHLQSMSCVSVRRTRNVYLCTADMVMMALLQDEEASHISSLDVCQSNPGGSIFAGAKGGFHQFPRGMYEGHLSSELRQ